MTDSVVLINDLSVMEPGNVDNVVFFGPVTTKELKVRENFLNNQKIAQTNLKQISANTMEWQKDISDCIANTVLDAKTDSSVYESFSVDDSKYESFEDSLYGAADLNPKEINVSQFLSDQVHVNVRKTTTKQKHKSGYFCDSLEDIHSLVSNAEKFSTSEGIENVNIHEKSAICEDSLRNDIHLENKNPSSNEQYFDDDSLAILEFEKAFDDSLEESDFAQLNRIDAVAASRYNADSGVEKLSSEPSCVSRNHFETSIEIIYEDVENPCTGSFPSIEEQRNNSTDYSQSLSDYMSRDSLEEKHGLPNPVFPTAKSDSNSAEKKLKVMLGVSNDIDIPDISSTLVKHNTQPGDSDKYIDNENCKKDKTISSAFKILPLTQVESVRIDECSLLNTKSKNKMSVEVIATNSNDTIWIDDSFCSQTNLLNEDHSPFPLKNSECESKNSNDTIWIEDSFYAPPDNSPVKQTESANQGDAKVNLLADSNICVANSVSVSLAPDLIKKKRTPSFKAKELKNQKKNDSSDANICIQKPKYLAISPKTSHSVKTLKKSPADIKVDTQMAKNLAISPVSLRPTKTSKNSPVVNFKPPAGCSTVTRKPIKTETTPVSANVLSSPSHNEQLYTDITQNKYLVDGVSVPSPQETVQPLPGEIQNMVVLEGIEIKNTDLNFHHRGKNPKSTGLSTEKNIPDQAYAQKPKNLVISSNSHPIKTLKNSPVAHKVDAQMRSQFLNTKSLHSKVVRHDKKLIQALDLHDTSFSFSESVHLQSRDSIMPLNLCIKDTYALNSEGKENIPFISTELKSPDLKLAVSNTSKPNSSSERNKGTPSGNCDNKIPIHLTIGSDVKKSGSKIPTTKIPIRKVDNVMPTPVSQRNIKQNLKSNSCDGRSARSPVVKPISSIDDIAGEVCEETPRKHHFCMVRNSISRVPKSAPKPVSKKFQYIESPVAKYIGSAQLYTPVKSPHHVHGKILANILPTNQISSKVGCNAFKNLPETPTTLKMGRKY